ncbi:MAG: translation initiation factor IF-2 [Planctomycetota bacterium]|nr:translation initiation factor IF-2 [Planctomycetota bacterium]
MTPTRTNESSSSDKETKIRLFALAKELDIDSKLLIKHCNDAGIQVKASALASISPDEKDVVLKYMESLRQSSAGDEEQDDAMKPPSRDRASEFVGKIRSIKTMSPRTPSPRTMKPRGAETSTSIDESQNEAGEKVEAELSSSAETDAQYGGTPSPEESAVAESAEGPTTPADAPSPQDKMAPLRRDDYVSSFGASPIREMKPRSSSTDRRTKEKSKPALPSVAAPPTLKLPKPKSSKKDEGPAQKPDLRFTAESMEQHSPLAAHLKKNTERKKEETPGESDPRRGSRFGNTDLADARQQRREKRRQAKTGTTPEEEEASPRRSIVAPRRRRGKGSSSIVVKTSAEIDLPISVRSLSEAMGRPAKVLLQTLFNQGQMVTINTILTEDVAEELAMELGVDLLIRRPKSLEDSLLESIEAEDDPAELVPRSPIITILGHVDHGKTTLVDKIRSANVAGGEAGGITQHIAAYQVEHKGQKITFVDTPGHAAFGEMRARGANVTDIVVLVVAADDGVMPQTIECISHSRAAGVPMVVAMNKIDRPSANEQKVLQELASQNVLAVEWGGDTEVIRTSATEGTGIEQLLETLLLTAELNELKANPNRPANGVCLEAFRDEGRGNLAWIIVRQGTLRIGDYILCGPGSGRIRAMYNDRDEEVTEAGPSTPVKVAGLDVIPGAGDLFVAVDDIDAARDLAQERRDRGRTEVISRQRGGGPRTLEDILESARGGIAQDLPLIIKADTLGSLEALRSELGKFDHPEVRVKLLHEGVGGVNESDVSLASASGAIIIAFHVIPEDRAQTLAEQLGVDVRRYNIIYEVTDDIKLALEGLLTPERVQVSTGRAIVLRTFHISRFGTVAGCRILNGTIERNSRIRVIRDQKLLNDYGIASLKREKDDVKEVREGMECGIRMEGFNDVKEGDLLEAYRVEEVKRTLDS